ncbi:MULTISPECIES: putative Ig domain-containing protein [unclassified Streptococcus]|uniref:putative Ig domain-containing protein n=1 Tax=unclassified Streptococcus TaxID=2608887 RepID=UPI00211AE5FE|nr:MULTISPECIES: putative Ig domain-containing protein [unclassified Streptococcus]MCQ9212169.1 putative Ig domain-containing protein [Streptococcus sp. B01]MCQ9213499.1 putative Ig domain-containing protein [Streptococcus sp. O1]
MSKKQRNKKRLRLEQKRLKAVVAAAAIGTTVGVGTPLHAEEVPLSNVGTEQVDTSVAEKEALMAEGSSAEAEVSEKTVSTEEPIETTLVDKASLAQTLDTLNALIEQSANTDTSDKTAESVTSYEAALAVARQEQERATALKANLSATQAEIDAQNHALIAAISTLSQARAALVVSIPAGEESAKSEELARPVSEPLVAVASGETIEVAPVEREVALSYKVVYQDIETGERIASENHSVTFMTTDEVGETKVTEVARAIEGYVLAENQNPAVVFTIREKERNILIFNLARAQQPNDTVVNKDKATFRANTAVDNDKPYITIERYWGTGDRSRVEMTSTKNGDTVELIYKTGLTRITSDEVELTEDAKKLGLTYDPVANYIRGNVELGVALAIGDYQIGLVSKSDSTVKATALWKVQSHKGFVPRVDATYTGELGEDLPSRTSYNVTGPSVWIGGGGSDNFNWYVKEGSFQSTDGETVQVGGEFSDGHNQPATNLRYRDLKVTTTPFGYYIGNGTIENATSTTQQYQARFSLLGLDDLGTFSKQLTIAEFKQTGGSAGVELEFIDKSELYPANTYWTLSGYPPSGGSSVDAMRTTPYLVNFKKLPDLAGNYYVTFQVTDNLGLTKDFRIDFTTIERSQNGALTNADIKFEGNKDYTLDEPTKVRVPISSEEQELGVITKNKENATLKPVRFPDGTELTADGRLVKKAGAELLPGKYTFDVGVIDGHFGDNAPTRTFEFEVVDAINPISHQIWKEGEPITPISITMKKNTPLAEIKVIPNDGDTFAVLSANNTDRTLVGHGLTRTTEPKTARVEAQYLNANGETVTVVTHFTYEVQPGEETGLELDVTNANQTVVEGTRWEDMVITHTEGATLTVDRTKLPAGVRYNNRTKTISGRGLYEGTYKIPITVEKDGKSLTKMVNLTVTPGEFVVAPVDETVQVLDSFNYRWDLPENYRISYAKKQREWDIEPQPFEIPGISIRDLKLNGTPTKAGTYETQVTVIRVRADGTKQSANTTFKLTVTPLPHIIEVSNDNQTITRGDSITPMVVTGTEQATRTLDTENHYLNEFSKLPKGLIYDSETGIISGIPEKAGTYRFDILSKIHKDLTGESYYYDDYDDAKYSQIRKTVTITVLPKPLEIGAPDREVTVLSPIEPIIISHTDGSILDESFVRYLPEGVTYDSATKTISGTPTRAGEYRVYLFANYEGNGQGITEKMFTIKVNPLPASIEVSNNGQTIQLGEPIKAALVTNSEHSSIVGRYLSTELEEADLVDYIAKEYGLTYNPATKTISGTPKEAGVHRIRFGAQNPDELGRASAETVFEFTVLPDSPISLNVTNDRQFILLGDSVRPLNIKNSDNTTLTVDETTLPEGLVYDAATKQITGTPTKTGKYDFVVTATSQDGSKTLTHTVSIDVIELPKNDHERTQSADPRIHSVIEGQTTVSGTGLAGATIMVALPDGSTQTATVAADGTWSVENSRPFVKGQSVTVKQTESGKTPSDAINATAVPVITQGDKGEPGRDGVDGKSPTITTERGTDTVNGEEVTGTWIIVTPADGGEATRTFMPDGKNGTNGQDGAQGEKGESGKSPTVTTERGTDTVNGEEVTGTWIIVTPADGGEATRTFVSDGKNGTNGQDGAQGEKGESGKSPTVTTERGTDTVNGEEVTGTWIIVTPADGGEATRTFVSDGKNGTNGQDGAQGEKGEKGTDGHDGVDGKTPSVETVSGKGTNSDGVEVDGTWIITKDGDGNEVHRTFIPNGAQGEKGTDGRDGVDGKTPSVETVSGKGTNSDGVEVDGTWIITKDGDGNEVHRTFIPNGAQGEKGTDGRDGVDGKTPSVETVSGKGTNSDGVEVDGTWIITKDGDGNEVHRTFIPNGAQGEKGEKGTDGRDGVDGKTPSVETVSGKGTNSAGLEVDGTWIITKDGDGNEVHRTFIPNGAQGEKGEKGEKGADGRDGVDGKTPSVETVSGKGTNSAGVEVDGTWIITKDGDGNEVHRTFIPNGVQGEKGEKGTDGRDGRDGVDGKSPTVKTEPGKDTEGNTGIWVIISDGDGNEISREFVRDGKDGKSPTIKTIPGKNTDGHIGVWVVITDASGNEISREFVRDGVDGKDGRDGVCTCINKPTPEGENPGKPTPPTPEGENPGKPTPPTPGGEKDPGKPTPPTPGGENPDKPTPPTSGEKDPDKPTPPTPGEEKDPGKPTPPTPGEKDLGKRTPLVPSVTKDTTGMSSIPNVLPLKTFNSDSTTPQRMTVSNSNTQLPNTGTETASFLNLLAFASLGLAGVILSRNRKQEE